MAAKTINISQTLEFVETRAAKVTSQRAPFEGRVMTDQQQENYLRFKEDNMREMAEEAEDAEQKDRKE